jgi:hypothetical protein
MQQLAQLENVIMTAPDPEATLNQAAEATDGSIGLARAKPRHGRGWNFQPQEAGAPSEQRNRVEACDFSRCGHCSNSF